LSRILFPGCYPGCGKNSEHRTLKGFDNVSINFGARELYNPFRVGNRFRVVPQGVTLG